MYLGFTSLGSKEQRARNKDVINPTPPTSSGQSKQWYNSEIQVFAPCSLNAEAATSLTCPLAVHCTSPATHNTLYANILHPVWVLCR